MQPGADASACESAECRACDRCRGRKRRCDEGNPCANCKIRNLICTFNNQQRKRGAPKKPERAPVESPAEEPLFKVEHTADQELLLTIFFKYINGQLTRLVDGPFEELLTRPRMLQMNACLALAARAQNQKDSTKRYLKTATALAKELVLDLNNQTAIGLCLMGVFHLGEDNRLAAHYLMMARSVYDMCGGDVEARLEYCILQNLPLLLTHASTPRLPVPDMDHDAVFQIARDPPAMLKQVMPTAGPELDGVLRLLSAERAFMGSLLVCAFETPFVPQLWDGVERAYEALSLLEEGRPRLAAMMEVMEQESRFDDFLYSYRMRAYDMKTIRACLQWVVGNMTEAQHIFDGMLVEMRTLSAQDLRMAHRVLLPPMFAAGSFFLHCQRWSEVVEIAGRLRSLAGLFTAARRAYDTLAAALNERCQDQSLAFDEESDDATEVSGEDVSTRSTSGATRAPVSPHRPAPAPIAPLTFAPSFGGAAPGYLHHHYADAAGYAPWAAAPVGGFVAAGPPAGAQPLLFSTGAVSSMDTQSFDSFSAAVSSVQPFSSVVDLGMGTGTIAGGGMEYTTAAPGARGGPALISPGAALVSPIPWPSFGEPLGSVPSAVAGVDLSSSTLYTDGVEFLQ